MVTLKLLYLVYLCIMYLCINTYLFIMQTMLHSQGFGICNLKVLMLCFWDLERGEETMYSLILFM